MAILDKKCKQCGKIIDGSNPMNFGRQYCSDGCKKQAELLERQSKLIEDKEKETYKQEPELKTDGKPGFITRQIIKFFKLAYYLLVDRKGNILAATIYIILSPFILFSSNFEEAKKVVTVALVVFIPLGLFRNYKIYKNTELKIHEQFMEDCLGGFADAVKILLE